MAVKGKKADKLGGPDPEAKEKVKPTKSVTMPEQEELIKEAGGEVEAPEFQIEGDYFAVNFVRPRFELNKNNQHVCGMDFSCTLSEEHLKLLPEQIAPRWGVMMTGGTKRIDITDIPAQRIHVRVDREVKPKGSEILLVNADIARARVEAIQSKGDGKRSEGVRLSFTAYEMQNKDLLTFAAWKHGADVWIQMGEVQEKIPF